jgi:glyoxylase I family protein
MLLELTESIINSYIAPKRGEVMNALQDAPGGRNVRIRRLHHHAIRTKDMEKTRHFYEDLLGLPLVGTWKEAFDPTRGRPSPYLHCFFELADRSALAFFLFAPGGREDPPLTPQDGLDHHLALAVDLYDDVLAFKARLDAENYRNAVMDHGYCFSLYVRDPNEMLVEITADPPDHARIYRDTVSKAHADLQKWLDGDYSVNNELRDHSATLPTSKPEDLLAVVGPHRPAPWVES